MRHTLVELETKRIVGRSKTIIGGVTNPNLQQEIDELVQPYIANNMGVQIPARVSPGVTFCVYTDYVTDHMGDFTYFIGEESDALDSELPVGFSAIEIPAYKYAKFTTGAGPMPNVLLDAWQQIWTMSAADLGGERAFNCNFEIYDERATDPANTELDIYVGIK